MKPHPFYQVTANFIAIIMITLSLLAALPVNPAHAAEKTGLGPTTGAASGSPGAASAVGSLAATYPGEAAGYNHPGTAARLVVKAATTTTLTSDDPDPSVIGQVYVVTYTVTSASGNPTGNVTVSEGANTCTGTVAAGSCMLWSDTAGVKTLTATYAGDASFSTSSGTAAHTVKYGVTTTITSDDPDPSVVGQAIVVTYTVTSPNWPGGTPTGNVTVSDGTDTCMGTVAAGSCTLIPTTAGAKTLTAQYPGDASFGACSGEAAHQVNLPGPSITSLAPTSAIEGGPAFTLTVNGTGFVAGSIVLWGESDLTTILLTDFVSDTQLTAWVTGDLISSAHEVPLVNVGNPLPESAPQAAAPVQGIDSPHKEGPSMGGQVFPYLLSNSLPFFITKTGALVTGSSVATGVNPAATYAAATANATGTGTLVVAQYTTNPGGTPNLTAAGGYYDVHITPPGAFTQVIIQFCGFTSSDTIYFWNGAAWVQASNQVFISGCWTVTVNASTVPSLTDLGGAVFGAGQFSDTTTFADVPASYWAVSWIDRLYAARITSGCSTNPLNYCPEQSVTRAQMAVFLERGMRGSTYTPPPATGTVFGDVLITTWAANWIEKLYADGITSGCGGGYYCPDAAVTRAQMAIFLLKARHGAAYLPPPAVGIFTDVPTTYWAAHWIEQLYTEQITGGCGTSPLTYCPDAAVTRAQMAVFLVRAFNLP